MGKGEKEGSGQVGRRGKVGEWESWEREDREGNWKVERERGRLRGRVKNRD